MTMNSDWADRKRKKTWVLFGCTASWLASFALATFGPALWWEQAALSIAAVVLNVGLGVAVVLANMRLLACVDELERKVSMDAMAITLGVGFVVGFGYSLLTSAGLVTFVAEPHHLLVLMALVLVGASFFGLRRLQ